MVIDIHYHLFDESGSNDAWLGDMVRICVASAPLDNPVTIEEARENLVPKMFDPTGEITVRNLDQWGIDKAVVLVVDNGFAYGEVEKGIEGQNKAVAEAAKRFHDRLIAFLSVDPRRPDAIELVDRCVNDWGMRGLKCHPDTGSA